MTEPSEPPESTEPPESKTEEQRTRIIRRAPTGPLPVVEPAGEPTVDPPTAHVSLEDPTRAAPGPGTPAEGSDRTAVGACAVSIVSGWATSVVATDLVTGWWRLNHLFCIAVAFLALVFAVSTVSGVIALLQRRPVGRYLIIVGAVVALLTYGGLFLAGARVAWIVHALPLLPLASVALALHPQTKRWLTE